MSFEIVFDKGPRLRFIGHLDLMRTMQRALRRSGLPLAFSQGFNPHILMSFAAPLSVGMSGANEILRLPLAKKMTSALVQERLAPCLPPDITIVKVRELPDDFPAPMARLFAADFALTPLADADKLIAALPGFLAQTEIMAAKKTKKGISQADIRPLIFRVTEKDGTLHALLALSGEGTLKPELFMTELARFAGVPMPRYEAVRLRLYNQLMVPLDEDRP